MLYPVPVRENPELPVAPVDLAPAIKTTRTIPVVKLPCGNWLGVKSNTEKPSILPGFLTYLT
jgi:hypothetical protein